ncbi:Phosphatidyl-N-methylethanolamine N-methyltransferase [Friedmanniomyces endolithicus]|uniref:Phosphatidyl-N-methylethanolamine N-methyltransferase n=1 Tax=Friedmanniomyces endolithicus TaxID=329885 RepID=A0AAN6FFL8_9PEZI|nr:Phosphatidyl-N-methylethanolamine N-methyltransferase [Friedmanniomyces endolithicus]KAK0278911.1 Phosphatidyl-N-methylethanolamine N-methyltransferase [Friedmanniomyces endolithicus]KAK0313171.1 Phosphatidyl-N-methylethanolamine N-methyltransferase [Friedmanniomyces endolithicus]KAK0911040.1 Phosphatidyl-N-methylethanolamine N-methyltransferase [Friedmanniomyces endolithicus]KAK0970127.1 Phosphatidyl-N-methylethanolamine N-methyltransferase [Friedmanniomyces endolithicus]
MANLIDFTQPSLYLSAATILFNPLYWNLAARNEYHHHTLTTLFNHNALHANYALALSIFLLGLARDAVYESALRAQPTHPLLLHPVAQALAVALVGSGSVLVLSSMYALGITGTYLGDYFGILMEEMVTGFPFSVTGSPMYWGSTMSFLGTALWFGKPAGVVLAGLVWGCYVVALGFEDPFTREIYARREREKGKKVS